MDLTDCVVDIVDVSSPSECAELAQVLAGVWGFTEPSAVVAPDALRAMAATNCYVAAVAVDGRMVGGGVGWPVRVGHEWRLHSHVVGFLDGYRALGLGFRIKHHQRDFVRTAGLDAVEWTYDPLHAANARFNLAKLGAQVASFHVDFYGDSTDQFSHGLGTDRFLVRWGLDDSPADADDGGRVTVLAVGPADEPVITPSPAATVRAEIPGDIVSIRSANPALAMRWRSAFKTAVGAPVAAGATIVGLDSGPGYLIDR